MQSNQYIYSNQQTVQPVMYNQNYLDAQLYSIGQNGDTHQPIIQSYPIITSNNPNIQYYYKKQDESCCIIL